MDEVESINIKYSDVIVPLESTTNSPTRENYSDLESDEDDARPKFNQWKGEEMDLYLLGPFASEFHRNIKRRVRPEMITLNLDPFYRHEIPDSGEPVQGKVYRIWKNRRIFGKKFGKTDENPCPNTEKAQTKSLPAGLENVNENVSDKECIVDEDDDNDNYNVVGYEPSDFEPSDSDTEADIAVYVDNLKIKKKEGKSLTDETLWYDESKDLIRNLHDKSYSLTSYVPPDNNLYGKTEIMKSILTSTELKMLQPLEIQDDENLNTKSEAHEYLAKRLEALAISRNRDCGSKSNIA